MSWLLRSSPPAVARGPALFLLGCLAAVPAQAVTVTALPANPANVITSGFESPAVAGLPGGFAYAPAGTNWTFECSTGIAAVGGAFNVPATPQGSQAGLLQTPGAGCALSRMTRSFTITTAGRYRLSLQSAQRLSNQQIASVRIDGSEIGQFKPAGSTFEPVVFDALVLGAGTHQLSFSAVATNADHTLFIDDVRVDAIAAEARAWSSASTWDTGSVPTASDAVVIPAGSSVLMDGVLAARSVSVSGRLYCADSNINLDAEWVMVMGRLVCGATTARYTNTFVLTLKGSDDGGDVMGMGDKFLGSMGAGAIELHGEERVSFMPLRETAEIGATSLKLAGVVNWRTGDELVVAPTRWVANGSGQLIDESERVAVQAIVTGGPLGGEASTVQLKAALQYRHFGKTTNYSKPDNELSWVLDERAEVGLLTRNIRIQGDDGSTAAGFGGHMMSMRGSSVHASGIELRRMGQKAKLARYPFHWHLARDVAGQYIQNSSIHQSYNRCVVVHGSHRARVADNVCYDFVGHGYFLENGNEKKNVFDHNLAVLGRKPQGPAATPPNLPLESDLFASLTANGPAGFWISHPDNVVTNNVVAGSDGSAFWYHLEATPFVPPAEPGCDAPPLEPGCTRPPPDSIAPKFSPFGVFDNNRAYASRQGFSSCLVGGDLSGLNMPNAVLERLTTTNVGQGIWPCTGGGGAWRFHRAVVANTENGMQAPLPFAFSDSLFVAYSENEPPGAALGAGVPWSAVWMYDQGFDFDNVHFENYDRPMMSVFQRVGGAYKSASNRTSRLSFTNSPNIFRDIFEAWLPGNQPTQWGEVIHDLDGSLIGLGANGQPRAFTSSHPLMTDASCSRPPHRGVVGQDSGVDGYGCPHHYATFMVDELLTAATPPLTPAPYVTIVRSDGVHDTGQHGLITMRAINLFIADGSFRYGYRYRDGIRHNRVTMMLFWARVPGTTTVHELMDVPASTKLHQDYGPYWTQVTTQQAFDAAMTSTYFYREDSASMLVKIVPTTGADWAGNAAISFCLDGNPQCGNPPTMRTLALPTVSILSPVDKARVAAGTVSVSASLGDANGLVSATLWAGDIKGSTTQFIGSPTAATPTLSVNLPQAGSYPLKLVVKNVLGQSYTAVQQLHIGDVAPRIEITSAALSDNSTHAGTSMPTLTFASYNWSGSGKHVHWFLDGKDQGDAAGGGIALGSLGQGRHVLEVALADAAHNVYPMRDRRVIHVVRNGYLADFEDGVDARGSLTTEPQPGSRLPINYAWTYPTVSRVNPVDNDVNWFEVPMASPGHTPCSPLDPTPAVASYSLALTSAMNWSGYTRLQINYAGPGFDVLVHYAGDATPTPIGCVVPGGGSPSFVLPSRPGVPVDKVILLHYANPPNCTGCLQQQLLNSIRLLP